LLAEFEDAEDYLDWDIGTHGIYITFTPPSPLRRSFRFNNTRALTATYLPDVIPEQGWTKVEAVDSAVRKAGWDGVIDDAFRQRISVRRYQSKKRTVTWDEYIAWRSEELKLRL
jgi:AMME syndrome candidate gene 1 protein